MNFKITILFVLLSALSIVGQTKKPVYFPEVDSINQMLCSILQTKSDINKNELNAYLVGYFREFLETEESWSAEYDSVKYLGVLKSDDGKLRVFTWNLNYKDGSFKYFGFLQYKDKDNSYVFFLDDKKQTDNELKRLYQTYSEWYGALYYEIITTKWNSRTFYTLIGWDGADFLINRKVVEVLTFDRRGMPEFGNKSFKLEKTVTGRLIFEYADRATMLLRYNKQQNMIVLDHLSPPEAKYKGLYQYYGPDFSYDAFSFRAGRWHLISDIDPEKAINYKRNNHINTIKRRRPSENF
ncbi:MAG: hypothetical protein PHE33_00170 [Bacteroidales bacterium]|nr:hypothetical protein [Bacteroidales bacterium]